MTLTLWGSPDSGHACKVALALALADLPHERRFVDIWAPAASRPAAFLAASPFAEVPLLQIGEETLIQSGSILLEIARRYGVLGGETAQGLTRAQEILLWEANRIGMCLPQLKGGGLEPAVEAWLKARYETDAARFAHWLGDAPFFNGDSAGIADCAVWGYVQWLPEAAVSPTPVMAAWIARMRALPQMKTPQDFFPK